MKLVGFFVRPRIVKQQFALSPLLRQDSQQQKQVYRALLWAPGIVQTQGLEWDFLYQRTDQYIEDCSDHANLIFPSGNSNAKETKLTKHSHTCLAVILSFTSCSNRKEQFVVLNFMFIGLQDNLQEKISRVYQLQLSTGNSKKNR